MEKKRQWYSRLLLCIFVPMLLLASVHVHQPSASVPVDCYACLHHIHHDGHLTSKTLSIDNCLLCHFLTTPYVSAAIVAVLFTATITINAVRHFKEGIILKSYDAQRLRAPPVCL